VLLILAILQRNPVYLSEKKNINGINEASSVKTSRHFKKV
jgi:hypothetical protein